MHLYDYDGLRLLSDKALSERSLPPWVSPSEIETGDLMGEVRPDEALADYWMTYLAAAERGKHQVDARKVVTDFIELVEQFERTYPLSMMSSYIGNAIRGSTEKAVLLERLERASEASSEPLKQAWHDFMLDCREDAKR